MSSKPKYTYTAVGSIDCQPVFAMHKIICIQFALKVAMVIQPPITPTTNECASHQTNAPENASERRERYRYTTITDLCQDRKKISRFLVLLSIILTKFHTRPASASLRNSVSHTTNAPPPRSLGRLALPQLTLRTHGWTCPQLLAPG